MIRTQVYLEEESSQALKNLAIQEGKKQSELIRQAINQFLAAKGPRNRKDRLKTFRGIWKNRKDLPDPKKLRKEWDRFDV